MQWKERFSGLLAERRADERRSVLLAVKAETDGAELRAIMLNISRSGAMLAAVEGPAQAAQIRLETEEGAIGGRVIWTEGYRFGVNFDRKLSQTLFDAIVERAHYDGRAR